MNYVGSVKVSTFLGVNAVSWSRVVQLLHILWTLEKYEQRRIHRSRAEPHTLRVTRGGLRSMKAAEQ